MISETASAWLIAAGVLFVFLTYYGLGKRAERRREAHFALLAGRWGAEVERTPLCSRFAVATDGRDFEVRSELRGDGAGGRERPQRYVSILTPLRGSSWDLHSVDVARRFQIGSSPRSFDEGFVVKQTGLPLREGWLTPDVRRALEDYFAACDARGQIAIDGGNLVYRVTGSPQKLSAETLTTLLGLQDKLAAAIERAR